MAPFSYGDTPSEANAFYLNKVNMKNMQYVNRETGNGALNMRHISM
jgi:hypothetical protein